MEKQVKLNQKKLVFLKIFQALLRLLDTIV